jgi:uncharacterized protein (TIRG00374 family)
MSRTFKRWIGIALAALGLILIFYHQTRSAEWKDFHWSAVWASIVHARPGYVSLAVAVVVLSYMARAYRWRFFMDPFKKASLRTLFAGQVLGFSSIFLIGRVGELVRPGYIAKEENVPFSAMLAILLLERVYDGVAMALLFAAALQVLPLHPVTAHGRHILRDARHGGILLVLVMAAVIIVLVLLRLESGRLAAWLSPRLKFLPDNVKSKLRQVFDHFTEGLDVIRNWKDLVATVLTTAGLWAINTSIVWLVFKSLQAPRITQLSWMSAALVLFCGAVGLAIQLPGVGGGFQSGIILALTKVFGVPGQAGTTAAILLFAVMLIPSLVLSLIFLLYEGVSLKSLRALTRPEAPKRATIAEEP